MENATKALLMAAGVLVGIMILSLGVYLYSSLSEYVSENQEQMELNANNKFNTQFLKYINMIEDTSGTYSINGKKYKLDFKLTIQDVITVSNLAYENNIEYGLSAGEIANANEKSLYVKVTAPVRDNNGIIKTVTSLESDINTMGSTWLSNDNGYEYKCTQSDIKISPITGRVYEINFR